MRAIFCLCIELLIPWLLLTDAAIYSTHMMRESGPKLIELDSFMGQFFKRKLSRIRRAVPEAELTPQVTEFDLRNDTTHNQALIHWSGNNSKVVFILTRKKSSSSANKITDSTLWRSTNYGKEYKLMTSAFTRDTILKSYFISPSNKRKVIFVDAFEHSSRIWRSIDEGETYESFIVRFSVEKIDFHPENSDWLLGYDKLHRELHCSMNFGKNWNRLGEEVTSQRFSWYVKGVDQGNNANKIVHFEYRHISTTILKKIYKVKSCYVPNCRPTAFQHHLDALENIDVDSLAVQDQYVFVQKTGAEDKLYVSYLRGPFSKALFPFYPGHAQAHYHIISSDGESVMMGVNHDTGMTHLFISDREGTKFIESLNHVRYFNKKTSDNKVFNVDAYEARGVTGTYFANKHLPDGQNQTYISWNNGQTWTTLTQNLKDLGGNKIKTCWNCSLNLHLSMEQTRSGYFMQSILAKKSFPGLIIAHGTYGRTVNDNPNEVMLFISQDNGMSWRIAKKQRHFVVVANRGTVIVAVKMIFLHPVNQLVFSYDYGATWGTYKFSSVAVNVDGILTEPGESTPHLTLFGHKTYADSWRIFQINMTPLFPRNCSYPKDFENITLPAQVQNHCHLGLIQKFGRLKKATHCLVLPDQLHLEKMTCDCTWRDYQCDLGYYLSGYVHERPTCVRDRIGVVDSFTESFLQGDARDECVDGYHIVPSGIRKISGDRCKNDLTGIFEKNVSCNNTAAVTTQAPEPNVSIQLLNGTKSAKVGDHLIFSVQGVSGGTVVWHVLPLKKSKNTEKKVLVRANFTLGSKEPGPYKVRAEVQGTRATSDWILVKFWYPIEKVYLYHPPVVAHSKPYEATAWTQTLYGLRGNNSLLGEVSYTWDVDSDTQGETLNSFSDENVFSGKARPITSSVQIRVTAQNPVSFQSTSGKMRVKAFTVHLVLEMNFFPPMESATMTDLWLAEFRDILTKKLFSMEGFIAVKAKYKLVNEFNLFVYIPPGDSLKVFVYFAPLDDKDTKALLLEAARAVDNVITENGLNLLLARHIIASVKNHYIIDYDGLKQTYEAQMGGNGGVIAVAIILVLSFLVVAAFTARHFLRKTRFNRYLHFRNLRSTSGGSHIVRNQDRAPIVDEEFIDDDLNAMEDLGASEATLQFQG